MNKEQKENSRRETKGFAWRRSLSIFGLVFALVFSTLCGAFPASFSSVKAASQGPDRPLTKPLTPEDPRSQLDPALLNLPEISAPQPKAGEDPLRPSRPAADAQEVTLFDVATKEEKRDLSEPLKRSAQRLDQEPQGLTGMAGNFGAVDLFDPSDVGEDKTGKGQQPKSIIGADDRIKIYNTAAYPWRTMCKLFMTFPDGSRFVGSGVLIGYKYVLTAGHCVFSSANGGWASSIQVVPGLNGTYMPYGSAWASYLRSFVGWTRDGDSNYDFALITLNTTMGFTTGWLGYAYYPSTWGFTGNLGGYPTDKDGGLGLYYDYGSIVFDTGSRVFHNLDTFPGQSGSGIYRIEDGQRYVFAVHTNGGSLNSGCKITSSRFDYLASWIASGY
jgi:V8-like Glu-specific endopeptidase